MVPLQQPIQNNQIGDFYLLKKGGDAVIDSQLLTDVVTFKKTNPASNGNVLTLENLGTGYNLITSGGVIFTKDGDVLCNALTTLTNGTILDLSANNVTIYNDLNVSGSVFVPTLTIPEINVSSLTTLKDLITSGTTIFEGISTFNILTVNDLLSTTFNEQVIINNVLDNSLLIQGNTKEQIGFRVLNQQTVTELGYSYLKLEANSNTTSSSYIELLRTGGLSYLQQFATGSNNTFEFSVNTPSNFTSSFTNEGGGLHNLLIAGTLQLGNSSGPIVSGISSLLTSSKTLQILGGLTLGSTSAIGSLKQPSLFGSPSLQIVTKQDTPYLSALVNSFDISSSNSGILVGTTRTDGIAFRAVSSVALTAGLPSSNGADQFIVFGNGGVSIGSSNNPGTGKLLVNGSIYIGSVNNPALSGDSSALYLTKTGVDSIFTISSNIAAKLRLVDSASLVNQRYFDIVSDAGELTVRALNDDLSTAFESLKVISSSGNIRSLTGLELNTSNLVLTNLNDSLYINSGLLLRASSISDFGIEMNSSSTAELTIQNQGLGIIKEFVFGNIEIIQDDLVGGNVTVSGLVFTPEVDLDLKAHTYVTSSGSLPNVYAKKQNLAGTPPHKLIFYDGLADFEISTVFGPAPIGMIVAWHKSLPALPNLPAGWVECNGGLITDVRSPMVGQPIPDMNNPPGAMTWASGGVFIRGDLTSNATPIADQFQGHRHLSHFDVTNRDAGGGFAPLFPYGAVGGGADAPTTSTITDGVNGSPRMGKETYPTYVKMVWIMRIF